MNKTGYFQHINNIFNGIVLAPQVAPRNFKLTAVSPYCVSLSYDPVLYPNGPDSGLVYQVKQWTILQNGFYIANCHVKTFFKQTL